MSCARQCGVRGLFLVVCSRLICWEVFSGKPSLCPEVFFLCCNSMSPSQPHPKHCFVSGDREIVTTLHFSQEPQYLIPSHCLLLHKPVFLIQWFSICGKLSWQGVEYTVLFFSLKLMKIFFHFMVFHPGAGFPEIKVME